MKIKCPGCFSINNEIIDSVSRDRLIEGYARDSLRVDIAELIPKNISSIDLLECLDCELRWYAPMIVGDAAFYEALQLHDWYYQGEKPEYRFAATLLSDNSSMLEVGCGRGAFAGYLKTSVKYRGLEFNDEAIHKAIGAGLAVEKLSIETEAEQRPAYYDVVCHFQVLEHVSDCQSFMKSRVAALKPGGLLLVTVPSEDSFLSVASSAWLNMPPHHVTRWKDAAMRHLFARLGLTMNQIWHEPVADFHVEWYKSTMRELALSRVLRQDIGLDNRSVMARLIKRIARSKSLENWLLKRGEAGFKFKGNGHSVCYVGLKGNFCN